ncbi:MAG: SH3 domain-containing protein [Clostridia bacterium]|nr:SH3 domain-containing protein [Clostridia bacterium]
MKRRIAVFLTVLLCLLAGAALADDYGKAVVDGGNASKVHLRAEASSDSESLGLFFTGTSVTLKSDPNADWVEVKIGRERGWMKAKYLKTGAAADRVDDEFWSGTVSATKYARMRKGPSTEYQFIRNVNDGENVTIMGETDEGWYYVLYKGDKGFISKNLIYTRGSSGGIASDDREEDIYDPMLTPVPVTGWRAAYRDYVAQYGETSEFYSLIYINDDDIPELVIDSGFEAGGCRILTYAQGQVNVLNTRRRGFTYIERGNRLCNSDGVMDQYFDDVYEIRNGRWVCIARGEYFGYLSGWNDILGRYVCKNYIWNGQKTDIGQYMISLSSVYDGQRAIGVEAGYSLVGIVSELSKVGY